MKESLPTKQTVQRDSHSTARRRGLALFFTLGVTLADWEKAGYLQRELNYYQRLAEYVGPVTFITYGGRQDRDLAARLDGIRLITNDLGLPDEDFLREASKLHQDTLAGAAIIKSNQIKGAQAVLKTAAMTGARAIIRGGYLLSRFTANRNISLRTRLGLWRTELAMFRKADRILLPTEEDAAYARRWYALPREKVVVLPNFVDVNLFTPREEVACEPGLIGFVGRLAPQKNLPALIEAVTGLQNVRLRLMGDGPQRDELAALAKDRGVHLETTGNVPHEELPRLLAECEVFVLPSLYEGLPKALLEAMAAGIPVLTTKVQGSGPLLRHRDTGWLCEETSPESLRKGLGALLSDSRLRAQIGRSARRFVVEHFSMESVLAREVQTYQELGCV